MGTKYLEKTCFIVMLSLIIFLFKIPNGTAEIIIEQDVHYGDDQLQKMDIYYRNDYITLEALPAVILMHGGGFRSGDKSQLAWYAIELAKKGFVAFSINYRLVPDHIYPVQIKDTQLCVRWIRANASKYNIDPVYIGAVGFSAGGHLASLLGTTDNDYCIYSSKVRCVVSYFGGGNLVKEYKEGRLRQIIEDFMGVALTAESVFDYNLASPTYHIKNSPIEPSSFLILHGKGDDILLPQFSIELYEELMKRNINNALANTPSQKDSNKLIIYNDMDENYNFIIGHGFHYAITDGHDWEIAEIEAARDAWVKALKFLTRHLKPYFGNIAPEFYPIGQKFVLIGKTIQFTVKAFDFDGGDTLNPMIVKDLPFGAEFTFLSNSSGIFTWTPIEEQIGRNEIQFIISDGDMSAIESVLITVVAR